MSLKIKAIAIVAGVTVFAGVSASAATLGTITTTDVGAGSNSIKGPATGVTVSYTTAYDATANSAAGGYIVTGVTVTPTPAFVGASLVGVTLKGSGGAALGTSLSGTAVAAATSITLPVSGTGATAIMVSDVLGVSVVINGTTTTVTGTSK